VAYPALVITYLSQAAYLIDEPQAYSSLFWSWVPGPVQWPMLILATAATIIASQALITASFSVVSQVMHALYKP
jgi:KUP system potassium uptake protein